MTRLLDYCPGCGAEPKDISELCPDCNACEHCSPGPRQDEVCDECRTRAAEDAEGDVEDDDDQAPDLRPRHERFVDSLILHQQRRDHRGR